MMMLLMLIPLAHACGGFFCSRSQPVRQAGENILFSMENGMVTATVQIEYSGDAADFSWVLPLPSTPTNFAVSSDQVFRALHQFSDPTFSVEITNPEGCEREFDQCPLSAGGGVRESGGNLGGVDVVAMGEVGPFVYTVIAAKKGDDGSALMEWLTDNDFDLVPPDASGEAEVKNIVARYVRLNHRFVTLKLQKGKDVGALVPIVLEYKAPMGIIDMSCIPLRLTKVAATQDMPVFAWIAGKSRAVPQNFMHLVPDFDDMPWGRCVSSGNVWGGFNPFGSPFGGETTCTAEYRELLRRTARKFGAAKWLTTDFAGAVSDDLLNAVWNKENNRFDAASLNAQKTVDDYLVQLLQVIPFDLATAPQTLELIRSRIPKPSDVSSECTDDASFYRPHGGCLAKYVKSFDAKGFTAAVEDELLKPIMNARDDLAKHSYLTRFFTEISPDAMVRDPIFRFSSPADNLPDVSHIHTATATYDCPADGSRNIDLVITTPSGKVLPPVPATFASCRGISVISDGQVDDDKVWPTTIAGRAQSLSINSAGELEEVFVENAAEFQTEDLKFGGRDDIAGVPCNPGSEFCACMESTCAKGLVCIEDTCTAEIAADGATTATLAGLTTMAMLLSL